MHMPNIKKKLYFNVICSKAIFLHSKRILGACIGSLTIKDDKVKKIEKEVIGPGTTQKGDERSTERQRGRE
jgi:hypothetical protein